MPYETVAIAPIVPGRMGFFTPLFRSENSNALMLQVYNSEHRIQRFCPIEQDTLGLEKLDTSRSREVGDEALFGFTTSVGDRLLGTRAEIAPALRVAFQTLGGTRLSRDVAALFAATSSPISMTVAAAPPPSRASEDRVAAVKAVASDDRVRGESKASGRPYDVTALLLDGEVDESWYLANRQANRFFILNLQYVISQLNLRHTTSSHYFERAARVISHETDWKNQYPFEYTSSKIQIYPKDRDRAKIFGTAATIIVSLELAAMEHSDINVYDYLRIIPAQYFIDKFDTHMLRRISDHVDRLNSVERADIIGAGSRNFEDACLTEVDQLPGELLKEMADGACVTRFVANGVSEFINSRLPLELQVGPVLPTGSYKSSNPRLGSRNAAPSLRVPRFRNKEDLPRFEWGIRT